MGTENYSAALNNNGAPPSPLLAVPNVTAHPSTASVPITVLPYNGPLLCGFNVPIKELTCGNGNTYLENGTGTIPCNFGDIVQIIIIIIKNECHSNIIVDRLQGCGDFRL